MKIAIVVGVSKGLGSAVVEQLLEQEYEVLGLSRNEPKTSVQDHPSFTYIYYDAGATHERGNRFQDIVKEISVQDLSDIVFIYNAAILDPVGKIGTLKDAEFSKHMEINFVAPLELSNQFLAFFQDIQANKRMVFITSGAASNPVPSWTSYSSSKAALDMMVKSIAAEQQDTASPVSIIGFNPGIMDTDMQATIRSYDENQFPAVSQFKQYHSSGRLRSAQVVAKALLQVVEDPSLRSGTIVSVENYV